MKEWKRSKMRIERNNGWKWFYTVGCLLNGTFALDEIKSLIFWKKFQ
jgi:hypothetical protein